MKLKMNLSNCRWMLYTNNNKLHVENLSQKKTWRKVYKNEYGNMKALCFQLLPSGKKVFVKESKYGEYWNFEDLQAIAGQTSPTHVSRNICSLKDKELGLWDVVTVDMSGNISRSIMTNNEIGYESRIFINKEDKNKI